MAVFNSLGSNYSLKFALVALFKQSGKEDREKLISFLSQKYGGEVYLTYKGRESIRLALKIINKQKEFAVGICGFTCYAVYDAVIKEGYKIEYLDIDESLNFSFDTFKKAFLKNQNLKILIIQNTLGNPCEIKKISEYCQEKNIILIEDLAHSIGAKYPRNREAGSVGDFTVLSFSQDKMIDAVSGGALVVRNTVFKIPSFVIEETSTDIKLKDRIYPILTWKIRVAYDIGLGRIFHFILKKLNLLSGPMGDFDNNSIYSLSNWHCALIYSGYLRIQENLNHRRKISEIYLKNINNNLLSQELTNQINLSSNLRFSIFVNNRNSLIKYLKQNRIYVSDIWYDSPVAPKRFLNSTNYSGECPESEKISGRILNLPTHRNINEKKAKFISEKINKWLMKYEN